LIEAELMELDYRSSVRRFNLVKINADRSHIVESKEFKLSE